MRKSENGFTVTELLLVIIVIIAAGCVGWFAHDKNFNKPQARYTSYSDCINRGGQALNYDSAIQFSACQSGSSLYLQYSAQNLPNIEQNKTTTTPNMVVATSSDTADLVTYLTYNSEGCSIGQPQGSDVTGYYKIVKEIPGWALLNYGCTNDKNALAGKYSMIAMKLSGGWVEISPTNNLLTNGTPSCLLVDMFKVPASLTSQCYQNTGYNDGSLRAVTYQ